MVTVPGAGAKPSAASSAFSRTSTACPYSSGGSPSSLSPAAIRIWALTRSSPVVASVTGCSTWSLVFTSMNANVLSCGW